MNFRVSQFAAVCGLSLLTITGASLAQTPRYQSPYALPAAPQPTPLPVPAAITPNGTVVEDVIARVNDQIISRSDMERSQASLTQEIQQNNPSPADAAEQEKNLLRDMIDKQLLLSRAKELGLNADADVIRRLDEIRKQNNMETMEDLEKAARQQGVSFEDFKANIRDSILTQQVVRDEVGRRIQMTQTQELAYFEAHKQEFEQPEQVRLSEILIPAAADASDATVAQVQAKADEVEAKIKAGAKFEDVAKTDSGGPTAAQGGDLGLFKRGALAKVLEDKTFSLKAGEYTDPIRTRQGFVILKVTEHHAAGVPPIKDVEPQIQEAMYMEQLQPAMRVYLTKLREDAYIDIKPGFVDSGASSKQTKPVFTAYTAPVVKKKKVEDVSRFDRSGRFTTASSKASAASVTAKAGSGVTSSGTTNEAVSTPTSSVKTVSSGKMGKQRKIKREKIRYGQAPRNSLPSAPTNMASDAGLGRPDEDKPAAAAPGAAMAPTESTTTNFSGGGSPDPDPLAPKVVDTGKTRYSSRASTIAATKAAAKTVKVKEKAAATPMAASSDEKAAQQVQSGPLGLNGDTAKKKKRTKVKGEAKERIQQKPKEPAAAPQEPTPYRTPAADGGKAPATAPATASN